jgi:hypothetical protein
VLGLTRKIVLRTPPYPSSAEGSTSIYLKGGTREMEEPKRTQRGRPADGKGEVVVTFLGPKAAAGYRKMLKRNPPPEREKNPPKRD